MDGTTKTPWHLWVVGILTLLFNAVGGFSYTMTRLGKLPELGMGEVEIAFFESNPAWSNALWALGVWGAIACSILLLLRSRFAVWAITIALIGLIGTTYYQNVMTEVPESLQSLPLNLAIWATTLFLLYYSLRMRRAGVQR